MGDVDQEVEELVSTGVLQPLIVRPSIKREWVGQITRHATRALGRPPPRRCAAPLPTLRRGHLAPPQARELDEAIALYEQQLAELAGAADGAAEGSEEVSEVATASANACLGGRRGGGRCCHSVFRRGVRAQGR